MTNTGYIPQSKITDENPNEEFFTPELLSIAAMRKFRVTRPGFMPTSVLEPGCGLGSHLSAALEIYGPRHIKRLKGIDVVKRDLGGLARAEFEHGSFLWTDPYKETYDLIATNPPFSLAESFIRKAWLMLEDSGYGFFLCKYSIVASQSRKLLWDEVNLVWSWVIRPRPSFTVTGKGTDATEYCYILFNKDTPTNNWTSGWLDCDLKVGQDG